VEGYGCPVDMYLDTLNVIINCVDSIVNLVFYKLKVYQTTGHLRVGRRSVFELLSKRSAWGGGGGGEGVPLFLLQIKYFRIPCSFLERCMQTLHCTQSF
jgi:hypothetical protein